MRQAQESTKKKKKDSLIVNLGFPDINIDKRLAKTFQRNSNQSIIPGRSREKGEQTVTQKNENYLQSPRSRLRLFLHN
jgi:hypothetical protein